MNECEPMVKANGYLIRRIGVVLHPVAYVTAQSHESLSNFVDWNPDVLLSAPVLPGPLPRLVEHPFMELSNIFVRRDICWARAIFNGPGSRLQIVFAFPFVEFLFCCQTRNVLIPFLIA